MISKKTPAGLAQPASAKPEGCSPGLEKSGCCSCREICQQLSSPNASESPLALGQVLLVFFLPLACAAILVILAVRYLPGLAEHPGYLALAALAVAVGAIVLAKVFFRKSHRPSKNDSE